MLLRDRKGAVYVEFLIVFPPFFVFFLCIVQLALLYVTHLGAVHSASMAARSASVVLDDNPVYYQGSARLRIEKLKESECRDSLYENLKKISALMALQWPAETRAERSCPDGPRLAPVRNSAILGMLPFSPNPQSILPEVGADILGTLGGAGWLLGAAAYSAGATAVSFPVEPGAEELATFPHAFEAGEETLITVRVTYLAHCGIPIARFFMCDRYGAIANTRDFESGRRQDSAARLRAQQRLSGQSQGAAELEAGVAKRWLLSYLLFSDQYFHITRAEATLPLQWAGYAYQEPAQ